MRNSTSLNPALKQTWDGKLARYALAGSVLFGLPVAAHAETFLFTSPLHGGPGQTVDINFDPGIDTTIDFSVTAGSAGLNSSIFLSRPATTLFNAGLVPLNLGDQITLANTNSTASTLMKSHSGSSGPTYNYPWGGVANGSSHYLGVKFLMSGEQHLGWAEITMNKGEPSFTIERYAYNGTAREGIFAGGEGIPEPSSISLFAAGAAGILALRRRRRAA
jgi:hypothetical protein